MVIIVQERGETKQESVVTGYGGTAGTGVDLCQWQAFDSDSDDDVDADADDNLIIDPSVQYTLVLSPKILLEVIHKSLRHPLFAPINRTLLDRTQRDRLLLHCHELSPHSLQLRQCQTSRRQRHSWFKRLGKVKCNMPAKGARRPLFCHDDANN